MRTLEFYSYPSMKYKSRNNEIIVDERSQTRLGCWGNVPDIPVNFKKSWKPSWG